MTIYLVDVVTTLYPAQNMRGIDKDDFLEIQTVLEKAFPKNKRLLSFIAMTIAVIATSVKPRGCIHVSFT